MMRKSRKSITDQGIPEVYTGSVKVSEPSGPEFQVGNTSGVGVWSLPKDHKMIIDESSDESFKGFNEVEVGLNSNGREQYQQRAGK